jgi:AcrR family transcriptional regulator
MAGAVKRIRRTAEDARRQILDAAEARLALTGPAGIRLQDVAADLGISHPVILHHFGSREGLIRALTQRAVLELRDRLIAVLRSADVQTESILGEVFNTFRGGLAQRLAWLAVAAPDEEHGQPDMVIAELIRTVHEGRVAVAAPGVTVDEEDTRSIVYLVATAAFGEAIFGSRLRKSAGLSEDAAGAFQHWFAELLRRHEHEVEGRPLSPRVEPPRAEPSQAEPERATR